MPAISAAVLTSFLLQTAPGAFPGRPILSLAEVFPKGGLFGPRPHTFRFSKDGRFAAWLWRPKPERRHGDDLWVLDRRDGRVRRLTSAEVMAAFSRRARTVVRDRRRRFAELAKKGAAAARRFWAADAAAKKAPRYAGIRSYRWSPAGPVLAFVYEGDLYTWAPAEDRIVRRTRGEKPIGAFRFAPDGRSIWFVRERRLVRLPLAGGPALAFDLHLKDDDRVLAFAPGPAGRLVAVTVSVLVGPKPPARKIPIPSYRRRFTTVREIERRVAGDPEPPRDFVVVLLDCDDALHEAAEPREVYRRRASGPRDVIHEPDWAPDGSRFCFLDYEQKSAVAAVHEVRIPASGVAAAKARTLLRWLHTGGPNGPYTFRPRYLADSRKIVVPTEITGFRHLHVFDPLYETLEPLTAGPYEVLPLGFAAKRRALFVQASKEGPERLDVYELDPKTRRMRRLSSERGAYREAAVAPDGSAVLAWFTAYGRPPALVLTDGRKAQRRLLPHETGLEALLARRPRFFSYANRHGQRIHGMAFEPRRRPGVRPPLLLYVYGGPLRSFAKNVQEGNYASSPYLFARYMCERHGWLAATIDPRGMSGYGAAFERANFERVGRPQVEDLVDGVREIVRRFGADPGRVAIHGWSFGGFQTQLCLYLAPKVFRAGIAGAGPTEWENYNSWYTTGTIAVPRPGRGLDRFSLLPLARRLEGRLLLVHGMEDRNVLFQDTVRVYRALLDAGKGTQVELFLDPSGGHGLGGDVHRLARYRKYEEFLLRAVGRGLSVY